ncbi:MAG: transketolase [Myxococcales bacterium]|jgi:transketolase|nr:transketolase [Myxococcales bacterium]
MTTHKATITEEDRAQTVQRLETLAKGFRIDIIEMLEKAGSGHPGGSLSAIDLVTALYFHEMRHDPKNPQMANRDRFVLSKGHAVPAQYAAMAEAGYFDKKALSTLRHLGGLQGHPVNTMTPGIEACTGSLGQGLSIAQGMAMAAKADGKGFRVYCIIGDGEMEEGQIWEAALSASKYELDNLVCILDSNKGQIDGFVEEVMPLEPIANKWRAFNWNVIEIDGHDFDQILNALDEARATKGKPTFILANTIKGKGVSFMEGKIGWHGAAPNKEQAAQAIEEIRKA